jgi:hypothetical protein
MTVLGRVLNGTLCILLSRMLSEANTKRATKYALITTSDKVHPRQPKFYIDLKPREPEGNAQEGLRAA